jgi:branched-chain amino acid transport system permease protein
VLDEDAAARLRPGITTVRRGQVPGWLRTLGPALVIVAVQQVLFPSTGSDGRYLWGLVLQGLTVGLLSALVALGMALVYRANRIVNFAQTNLGLVPAALAIDLIAFSGLSYVLAMVLGLASALVVGAVVELAIVRRFFHSPRLILTVATIGLAQLLAFGSLMLPRLWGEDPLTSRIDVPFTWEHEIAPYKFNGNHLVAWIFGLVAIAAVAAFLRFTHVGIAVRAAADRADRAALLGIPVGRLHTVVWAVAALLSFLSLYLQAGILNVPLGEPISLTLLLSALAALTLGRLTDMPAIVASAMALGLLESHVRWNDVLIVGPFHLDVQSDLIVAPVLAAVILITLVVRRKGVSRAESDPTSSWQVAGDIRPVPVELAGVREVRWARWAGLAVAIVALVALPTVLGPGQTLKAAAVVAFAIVILSITVLTGWAGQISLGQMGFVAIGAALAAHMVRSWGWDVALILPAVGLAGAVVAVIVGLPALRLRGLYLAVVTLAFALATTRYVVNPQFFPWVTVDKLEPGPVLGVWHVDDPTALYQLALVTFAVLLVGVLGIRNSRTGRVLMALRENERGAAAYGVSVVRAKLTAFALSGFLAAVGGALLVLQSTRFSLELFPEEDNLVVFTAAVVGGLGSVTGAVIGALFLKGGEWFLQDTWQLFASSIGVLAVLLLLPGGLGGAVFRGRDLGLRWVARRRGIVVPSLLADVRRLEAEAEEAFETRAAAMAGGASAPGAGAPGAEGQDGLEGSNGSGEEAKANGSGDPGDPGAPDPPDDPGPNEETKVGSER